MTWNRFGVIQWVNEKVRVCIMRTCHWELHRTIYFQIVFASTNFPTIYNFRQSYVIQKGTTSNLGFCSTLKHLKSVRRKKKINQQAGRRKRWIVPHRHIANVGRMQTKQKAQKEIKICIAWHVTTNTAPIHPHSSATSKWSTKNLPQTSYQLMSIDLTVAMCQTKFALALMPT